MELKEIVTSLKMSKALKKAGVKQDSIFYWIKAKDGYGVLNFPKSLGLVKNNKCISAFTLKELFNIVHEISPDMNMCSHCTEDEWAKYLIKLLKEKK